MRALRELPSFEGETKGEKINARSASGPNVHNVLNLTLATCVLKRFGIESGALTSIKIRWTLSQTPIDLNRVEPGTLMAISCGRKLRFGPDLIELSAVRSLRLVRDESGVPRRTNHEKTALQLLRLKGGFVFPFAFNVSICDKFKIRCSACSMASC
jgi:hypothetical protein